MIKIHHTIPSHLFMRFFIFLIVVVLLSGCTHKNASPPKNDIVTTTHNNTATTTVDTSDWLTYENKEYGFRMRYPLGFKLDVETFPSGYEHEQYYITIRNFEWETEGDEHMKSGQIKFEFRISDFNGQNSEALSSFSCIDYDDFVLLECKKSQNDDNQFGFEYWKSDRFGYGTKVISIKDKIVYILNGYTLENGPLLNELTKQIFSTIKIFVFEQEN